MRYWKPKKLTGSPRVGIAVAAYAPKAPCRETEAMTCLVASFKSQTYQNWYLNLTHDGPYEKDETTRKFYSQWLDDPRIGVIETDTRLQQFGHPHRQASLDNLIRCGCEWLMLTNQDNYYVPVYLEWLLHVAQQQQAKFVYCDFVRSHTMWRLHSTKPKKGDLDVGGFLFHKSLSEKIKFDKFTFNGDGDFIERLVRAAKNKTAKVSAALYVHN